MNRVYWAFNIDCEVHFPNGNQQVAVVVPIKGNSAHIEFIPNPNLLEGDSDFVVEAYDYAEDIKLSPEQALQWSNELVNCANYIQNHYDTTLSDD